MLMVLPFVLLVNQHQIESYIKTVYGEVDARAYLLKFANVFVDLPQENSQSRLVYEPGRAHYCHTLLSHHELSKKMQDARLLTTCISVFSEHFLRSHCEGNWKSSLAVLVLFYSTQDSAGSNALLVAMLSTLKVKNPRLYAQLKAGTLSSTNFFAETRMEQLKVQSQEFDLDWATKLLSFCLLSEDEYQKALSAAKKKEGILIPISRFENYFNVRQRTRIIPTLCNCLDRFSVSPDRNEVSPR